MGCWNETCIISNLPITAGNKVAMTVIINNDCSEWFKPTSLYYISPIMFYGEYNDYGSGENCEGLGLHYIADEYRTYKQLIEDNVTPDEFVDKIAQEEICFNNARTFKARLSGDANAGIHGRLSFIRLDILNRILEDYSWQDTFYEKNENDEFIHETINYQYYLDCIPETIKNITEYYKKNRAYEKTSGHPSAELTFHPIPELDFKDSNLLLRWLSTYDKDDFSIDVFGKSVGKKVVSMAEANQVEQLTAFLSEFAKYCILYHFMMEARKSFVPATNTSQESDTTIHQFLAKIITEVAIENIEAEYDDDNWDPKRKVFMEQCELDF